MISISEDRHPALGRTEGPQVFPQAYCIALLAPQVLTPQPPGFRLSSPGRVHNHRDSESMAMRKF